MFALSGGFELRNPSNPFKWAVLVQGLWLTDLSQKRDIMERGSGCPDGFPKQADSADW
jgi:hypothetical protein